MQNQFSSLYRFLEIVFVSTNIPYTKVYPTGFAIASTTTPTTTIATKTLVREGLSMGVGTMRVLKTFTDPVSFQNSLSGLQRVLGLLVDSSTLHIAISDATRRTCAPFGFLYQNSAKEDAKILLRAFEFAQEFESTPLVVGGAVVGIRCENSEEAKKEASNVRKYVEELLDNDKLDQMSSILYINQAAALKQAILRRQDYLKAREKIVERLLANRAPGARLPPDPNDIKDPREIIKLSAVDVLQYGLWKP